MPTYSYECKKCTHTFEVFHSIVESPKVKCTECGGASKRLMGTGGGIIFKGSGFYETEYKKKANGGSKTETPKTEASSGGEAKPETSAAPKKPEKAAAPKN